MNNNFEAIKSLVSLLVKKAGFDYVEDEGGHVELSRKGAGYTNSYINIYLPEDVASSSKPSFVMERVFK